MNFTSRTENYISLFRTLPFAVKLLLIIQVLLRIKFIVQSYIGTSQGAGSAYEILISLSEAVISGQPLYIGNTLKPRPPLWLFQEIFATWVNVNTPFDTYRLTHSVILIFVEIGTIYLLYDIMASSGRSRLGIFSSVIYVMTLPGGDPLTNKIPAVFFTLVSIKFLNNESSGIYSGISMGIAGLFASQAVVFSVVVGLISLKLKQLRWTVSYIIAGFSAVLVTYGLVAILYGYKAAINGFLIVSGIGGGKNYSGTYYATGPGHNFSAFDSLLTYTKLFIANIFEPFGFLFVILPFGLYVFWKMDEYSLEDTRIQFLLLLVGAIPVLLLRPWIHYYLLVFPSLSVIGAMGLIALYQNRILTGDLDTT